MRKDPCSWFNLQLPRCMHRPIQFRVCWLFARTPAAGLRLSNGIRHINAFVCRSAKVLDIFFFFFSFSSLYFFLLFVQSRYTRIFFIGLRMYAGSAHFYNAAAANAIPIAAKIPLAPFSKLALGARLACFVGFGPCQ